jgi:fucose 4-O-acetylase-like acetyltransferase
MKTIAMFLIIAGHCRVPGYKYVYVFSVPAFFIISGFLSKKENNIKEFWTKQFWNLVIPMFLFVFIHMFYEVIFKLIEGNFNINYLLVRPVKAIIGMQRGGLGVMWFVYTLIICKIFLQLIPLHNEKRNLILLNAIMLVLCYLLSKTGIHIDNAFVNVLLAMPFFSIGYFLKGNKEQLSCIKKI